MCSIIILNHHNKEMPLVIAANRDEDYNRPSIPVQMLSRDPIIMGGKDELKGGTWLAVNEHSLFVAITNQGQKNSDKASRGLIPLRALKCKTLKELLIFVEEFDPTPYNGFNLVFGNQEAVFVAHSYIIHSMVVKEIPKGVSVITNDMRFTGNNPKTNFIHQKANPLAKASWLDAYKQLKKVLANTEYGVKIKPRKSDKKIHGHCTRSSSILAFTNEGLARFKFYDRTATRPAKKEGEPYVPRYRDYIDLWREAGGLGKSETNEEHDESEEDESVESPANEIKELLKNRAMEWIHTESKLKY
jgi:transport and Golgi organization protein 2